MIPKREKEVMRQTRHGWRRRLWAWAVWGLAVLLAGGGLRAEDQKRPASSRGKQAKAQKPQYVRLLRDEKGRPVALQTAVVSYVGRNARGQQVQVDLIGAIHIADRAYYQELNRLFDQYDVLLYELVAPKGAQPRRGRAGMYAPIARFLGLADQIRQIDYEKRHFVHADMSPEEFAASMRQKKESLWQMFFKLMGASLAQQAARPTSDAELLLALLRQDKKQLRRVLAEQMAASQSVLRALEGEQGSTLIAERNKVALKVMQEQIRKGHRKLGIFYGAGHLEDMDRRLRQQYGFRPIGLRWLTAWDLR